MTDRNPSPRQLIILHTDAQAHNWLSCAGHPDLRTPNIDKLAARGVRFRRAYACNGVCVPSRSSLMTGRHTPAHGVTSNNCQLPPEEVTMGKLFKDAGFATGYFGKAHFGRDRNTLQEEGWEDAFSVTNYNEWLAQQGYEARYPNDLITQNQVERYWQAGSSKVPTAAYFENVLADRAIDFMHANRERDYLCFVSNIAPHGPFSPPADFAKRYAPASLQLPPRYAEELQDKPRAFQNWIRQNQKYISDKDLRTIVAHQYALVEMVDAAVGKIVGALQEQGTLEQTFIIFTSDHGEFGGRYGIIGKSWCMDDCLIRVPLIIVDPRSGRKGEVSDALVQNNDLLPTLLEYADERLPAQMQGMPLGGVLKEETSWSREAVFAFQKNAYSADALSQTMVCDGRWKLVVADTGEDQLYDLESDPDEVHNLVAATAQQDRLQQMRNWALRWMQQTCGQYYDPEKARYWEDETCFYEADRFIGKRIAIRSDATQTE